MLERFRDVAFKTAAGLVARAADRSEPDPSNWSSRIYNLPTRRCRSTSSNLGVSNLVSAFASEQMVVDSDFEDDEDANVAEDGIGS